MNSINPLNSGQAYALNLMDPSLFPFATGASQGLTYYINPLIRTSIVIAGLISFLLILGAGLIIIANAGNPQQQAKGKQAATAGVAGLALVVSAYWIVQVIQLLTGINILSSPL